jgi:glycosyltransferase involved in cell wall biosynthesis
MEITEDRSEKSPPLRILQVVTTSKGGDWFRDQVSELVARGHHVKAVLPSEGPLADRVRELGIEVEIVPICGWRPQQWPRVFVAHVRLSRILRRYKPDVVHAHLLKAHVACRLTSLVLRKALCVNQVTGTTHLRSPILRLIDRLTLPLADVVVGSCAAFAREYRSLGARAVAISYYGCDVHKFGTEASPTLLDELKIPSSTPLVGMVAHMYPSRIRAFKDIGIKGHEVLIDAIPHVLREFPNVRFVIAGDEFAGDGSYRRSLEERAARIGVSDVTYFIGHRADVGNVLASIDVLVSPSLEESASYAVIEALLMEKAVVASAVGGLPDSVQHGETGYLVPPRDHVALAQAVVDVLSDPSRSREMGCLGRQRSLRKFDIENTVSQIEEVYRSGLRRKTSRTASNSAVAAR